MNQNFELLHKNNILTNVTIGAPPKIIKSYIQLKNFWIFIVENKTNPDFYFKNSSSTFFPKLKQPIQLFYLYYIHIL